MLPAAAAALPAAAAVAFQRVGDRAQPPQRLHHGRRHGTLAVASCRGAAAATVGPHPHALQKDAWRDIASSVVTRRFIRGRRLRRVAWRGRGRQARRGQRQACGAIHRGRERREEHCGCRWREQHRLAATGREPERCGKVRCRDAGSQRDSSRRSRRGAMSHGGRQQDSSRLSRLAAATGPELQRRERGVWPQRRRGLRTATLAGRGGSHAAPLYGRHGRVCGVCL